MFELPTTAAKYKRAENAADSEVASIANLFDGARIISGPQQLDLLRNIGVIALATHDVTTSSLAVTTAVPTAVVPECRSGSEGVPECPVPSAGVPESPSDPVTHAPTLLTSDTVTQGRSALLYDRGRSRDCLDVGGEVDAAVGTDFGSGTDAELLVQMAVAHAEELRDERPPFWKFKFLLCRRLLTVLPAKPPPDRTLLVPAVAAWCNALHADPRTPHRSDYAPDVVQDVVDDVLDYWDGMKQPEDAITRAVREAAECPPRIALHVQQQVGPMALRLVQIAARLVEYRQRAGRGDTFGIPISGKLARLLGLSSKGAIGRKIKRLVTLKVFLPAKRSHRFHYEKDRRGRLLKPSCRTFRLAEGVVLHDDEETWP